LPAFSASVESPRQATGMAQILFVIALVLFVVSLFAGFVRRNNL
jgi:hypothetical protein